MNWPNKEDREKFEINGFIDNYSRLPKGKNFSITLKREKPDYIVSCIETNIEYGIELTSVYLSDRSVPDQHIPGFEGSYEIVEHPFSREDHERYKNRLLEAIQSKILKARTGYDCSKPLILSVYANEYTSLFFKQDELEKWVKANESIFDNMHPFSEIVLWNLPNGGVFQVSPQQYGT
jgi:hypothetical protein